MKVTLWEVEIGDAKFDITDLPKRVIARFCRKCKKTFGAEVEVAKNHVRLTIKGFKMQGFGNFLAQFCREEELDLSSLNLEKLF